MINNLKIKTLKGTLWSSFDKIGQLIVQLIINIFIARVLFPSDYGLIGMISIFIAISYSFVDSSFGSALMQKIDANDEDYSTVFYFNIFVGFLFYLILYVSAPYISNYFNEPKLINITRVISLSLIINSFGIIQYTRLTKQINFKIIARVGIISVILSGIIALVMAYLGFGVWSLVAQTLSNSCFRTVLFWAYNAWRPQRVFKIKSLKSLFSFGSKILISSVINQIFDNIYFFIIGKTYRIDQLGFYTQGKRMAEIPTTSISSIVHCVTYPVLSAIQSEDNRLKNAYRNIIKSIVFINQPVMMLLIVLAKPIILISLTQKWILAIPFFQLICVMGIMSPLSVINLNILKIKGRTDLFLLLEMIKKVLLIISIIFTIHMGILILILGQTIVTIMTYFINLYYSGKIINYSVFEQLNDIYPTFVISLMAAAATSLLNYLALNNIIVLLSIQVILFLFIYYSLSKLFKIEALSEITNLGKNMLGSISYQT